MTRQQKNMLTLCAGSVPMLRRTTGARTMSFTQPRAIVLSELIKEV